MSESTLNVQPAPDDPTPRTKREPKPPSPLVHVYSPSDDGIDENLLILLHGLGELTLLSWHGNTLLRHHPTVVFTGSRRYAHTIRKTWGAATINQPYCKDLLRSWHRVPYLYEEAYQWYESFDSFGELLERPNPTSALEMLEKLADHLVQECRWPPNRIHLFGFGQGGGLAAEFALRWWKTKGSNPHSQLASVVSIAGPLLSYPTLSSLCSTPTLVFHRPSSETTAVSSSDLKSFTKGFKNVQEIKGGQGEGMPRSKMEWEGIMRFWSVNLSRRQASGLYEVMNSGAT